MKTFPILSLVLSTAVAVGWAYAAQDKAPDKPSKSSSTEPDSAGVEGSASAAELLKQSRQRLLDYQPIKARVIEKVQIGERRFTMTGNYVRGKDLRLLLEFQVQIGDATASLKEICDGQVLWTRHQIGDHVRLIRRDVDKILKAAAKNADVPQNLLIADLGLGGLSGLLASLERTMTFNSKNTEQVGEHRFTVIEGTWNEQFAARWAPPDDKSANAFPEYVPDRVRVYFDENTFPRRILYLKKHASRDIYRPMVSLDFEDVVLNASVDNNEFVYVPPDDVDERQDVTNDFLQQLAPAMEGAAEGGKP